MSPHGESFVPKEFHGEPSKERPGKPMPEYSSRERDTGTVVSLQAEKRRRRVEDARNSIDIAIRTAGGNMDVVRQHVEQRLRHAREKIDKLENFDHAAQEESEFLKAQRDAIDERIRASAEAARSTEAIHPVPTPAKTTAEAKPPSLMDRMRSGWNGLKARLFGDGGSAIPDYKGTMTAYEEEWTPEHKAARGPAREANVDELQRRAIEKALRIDAELQGRLNIVNDILTKRHKEPMPASVRGRYVAEKGSLETRLEAIQSELNIATGTQQKRARQREQEQLRRYG